MSIVADAVPLPPAFAVVVKRVPPEILVEVPLDPEVAELVVEISVDPVVGWPYEIEVPKVGTPAAAEVEDELEPAVVEVRFGPVKEAELESIVIVVPPEAPASPCDV